MTDRRHNKRTTSVNIDRELAEEEEARKRAAEEAAQLAAWAQGGNTVEMPSTEVKRSKLGWKVRLDLKKACQQIALDSDMDDYEVLEMLLDEALAARVAKKVVK